MSEGLKRGIGGKKNPCVSCGQRPASGKGRCWAMCRECYQASRTAANKKAWVKRYAKMEAQRVALLWPKLAPVPAGTPLPPRPTPTEPPTNASAIESSHVPDRHLDLDAQRMAAVLRRPGDVG
jgi:hypothetical protein